MAPRKTPLVRIKALPSFAESGLPEPYVDRELPSLGISTVEDFLGLLETLPDAVAAETGADPEALRALSEEARARLVPAENRRLLEEVPLRLTPFGGEPGELRRGELTDFAVRGADREAIDMEIDLSPPEILPDSVSLLDACTQPVRDQGDRPACTVFAVVAILEYLLCRARNARVDLSEQYLYWLADQAGAVVEARAPLEVVFDLARTAGICRESLWSYEPAFFPNDLTHGGPPDRHACDADATGNRFDTVRALSNPRDVLALRQLLAGGHSAAVEIPLFQSYWIPSLYYGGQITLPLPGAGIIDHHDVVLVGYQTHPQDSTQDRFLIRNSVGPLWGRDSGIAAGHGTIAPDYIAAFAEKAWFGTVI
jgi:hypothetical protein